MCKEYTESQLGCKPGPVRGKPAETMGSLSSGMTAAIRWRVCLLIGRTSGIRPGRAHDQRTPVFPIAIISTSLKGNKLNKTLENKVYID